MKDTEVDLNYTVYCPIFRPYSSLYKGEKGEEEADRSGEMWGVVRKCTEEGRVALEKLRVDDAGPLGGEVDGRERGRRQQMSRGKKNENDKVPTRRKPGDGNGHMDEAGGDEDDEGGMGFFEK